MAYDLQTILDHVEQIRKAIYGEEVRGSISDSIELMAYETATVGEFKDTMTSEMDKFKELVNSDITTFKENMLNNHIEFTQEVNGKITEFTKDIENKFENFTIKMDTEFKSFKEDTTKTISELTAKVLGDYKEFTDNVTKEVTAMKEEMTKHKQEVDGILADYLKQLNDTLATQKSELEQMKKEIEDKLAEAGQANPNLELIDAREGEKTLKENLDKNYLKKKDAMFYEIEDANNATETGFYSVHSSAQNLPQKLLFLPSRVFMIVGNYEGDITQMAFTEEYIYTRTYRQNTWTTWLNYLTGDSSQLPLPENEFPKGDVVENIKAIYERVKKLESDSGHGGVEVTKVTYEELKDLVKQKQLIPGGIYVLTDYQTKYQQHRPPSSNKIITCEHVEDLILTANDIDSLRTVCYSTTYPQDIIHYDINNNLCEDKETPRHGFIVYRHDTLTGNICPYDFRHMLWARWCPDEKQYYKDGELVDYEVWTEGEVKLDVLYKADNQLLLAKKAGTPKNATDGNYFILVYSDTGIGRLIEERTRTFNTSIEIKKGELQERLTFGTHCTNNTFGENCLNNVLGDNCYNNTFGCGCYSNTFGTKCAQNILGNACTYNVFEKSCSNNMFGNNCDRNIFSVDCSYNNFGNNCDDNVLGTTCYDNTFANSCKNNVFGCDCDKNTFSNGNFDNTFKGECSSNTFGNACYNNKFETECSDNSFGNECSGNIFGHYCHSNSFGNYCFNNTLAQTCYYNAFGNGCSRNSFGFNSFHNSLGDKCYSNVLGYGCHSNTFYNNCFNNNFITNLRYTTIQYLQNKNLENISEIYRIEYSLTITRGKDSNYYYHFYNGSNEEYHRIP